MAAEFSESSLSRMDRILNRISSHPEYPCNRREIEDGGRLSGDPKGGPRIHHEQQVCSQLGAQFHESVFHPPEPSYVTSSFISYYPLLPRVQV